MLTEIHGNPFSIYEILSIKIPLRISMQGQGNLLENTPQTSKCQNMVHKYFPWESNFGEEDVEDIIF